MAYRPESIASEKVMTVLRSCIFLLAIISFAAASDFDKDAFYKCVDSNPDDTNICVIKALTENTFDTVEGWIKEDTANYRRPQKRKIQNSDLDKLYSSPPGAKKAKTTYIVDRNTIKKIDKQKYNIKLTAVTSEQASLSRIIINCGSRETSTGCFKLYDSKTKRLISKSSECESGLFGDFKTPEGDMEEVVKIFCLRYGNK